MGRLERLEARRTDPRVVEAKHLNEVYRRVVESESVRYAVGAMQPVDPAYTARTFEEGGRIEAQLARRLTQRRDFRYQGSTTNDTHIKAWSDIDLLVILQDWCWLQPPQKAVIPYDGDPQQDIIQLRSESAQAVGDAFPEATVDDSGAKALKVEGGSLKRKVDVVPATWFDTNDYAQTGVEHYRGVKVYDKEVGKFVPNTPFLHNRRIDERDLLLDGCLRRAARLMKSLKYDSDERVKMSSYNIVSLAYSMPDSISIFTPPFELGLVDACWEYCNSLIHDDAARAWIEVPDKSRKVFGGDSGATLSELEALTAEIGSLRRDILHENARSLKRLVEARVAY
jgi:hypothetical protein